MQALHARQQSDPRPWDVVGRAVRPHPSDLPTGSALRLMCVDCGRALHQHGGFPPDCAGFRRPLLPAGYAYASALHAGATIRFLDRGVVGRTQTVQEVPKHLDDENGLVELRVASNGAESATYLVQGTTVVRIVPALTTAA